MHFIQKSQSGQQIDKIKTNIERDTNTKQEYTVYRPASPQLYTSWKFVVSGVPDVYQGRIHEYC